MESKHRKNQTQEHKRSSKTIVKKITFMYYTSQAKIGQIILLVVRMRCLGGISSQHLSSGKQVGILIESLKTVI